jgi:hypothetical protein
MFVSFVQTAIEIWTLCSGATQHELLLLHSAGMHQGLKCTKLYITVGIHALIFFNFTQTLDSPRKSDTDGTDIIYYFTSE